MKTDIEVVQEKISDLASLWCVLNTCKGDESAKQIMNVISEAIDKKILLKRWNELHPLKKDPTANMITFEKDPEYMAKRKEIISRLLVNS